MAVCLIAVDDYTDYGSGDVSGVTISILLACALPFVVCFIFKTHIESVEKKAETSTYVAQESLNFTARADHFPQALRMRTEIQKASSGSGRTSVGSDGFSGKRGNFEKAQSFGEYLSLFAASNRSHLKETRPQNNCFADVFCPIENSTEAVIQRSDTS